MPPHGHIMGSMSAGETGTPTKNLMFTMVTTTFFSIRKHGHTQVHKNH